MQIVAKAILSGIIFLSGCATLPPQKPSDLCEIFREKPDWYQAALESENRWDVPVSVQMAVIRHESDFVEDARPPRTWFLGFIPTGRISSAYGYSQALDATWDRYLRDSGRGSGSRDDFFDASDFVGWYLKQTRNELGIPTNDAYRQYLAYHEGARGYARGSHKKKPALINVAKKVARTAERYDLQLRGCRDELNEEIDK